ncbi:kynurenine/alpha-aminoadipate aminotransferase, mitochondrial-like [Penaeus monodon]|uniref:kynurenine/alpha-aminoadipate aminotransferase, mitochondrial-like n=1 Tax=Penaeus monodon TaxID=6687 RepID=UPI0018A7590F|nr:kynurenine/alpha-aminoadipate aminotransferase, mitochondrial-like [Penaeus monodon]
MQVEAPDDAVFLMAGMPSPDTFPLVEGSLTLKDGRSLTLTPKKMVDCLQYGPNLGTPIAEAAEGIDRAASWASNMAGQRRGITTGSQSGLLMAMEYDYPKRLLIIEEPCYTGAISILAPYSPRYLPVTTDSEGMYPAPLQKLFRGGDPKTRRMHIQTSPRYPET